MFSFTESGAREGSSDSSPVGRSVGPGTGTREDRTTKDWVCPLSSPTGGTLPLHSQSHFWNSLAFHNLCVSSTTPQRVLAVSLAGTEGGRPPHTREQHRGTTCQRMAAWPLAGCKFDLVTVCLSVCPSLPLSVILILVDNDVDVWCVVNLEAERHRRRRKTALLVE